jgi:two-component system sensor histidine kinase KdpD
MKKGKTSRQVIFSALTVLISAAVCYPFADWIGYHSVALILLLVISVLAMRQNLVAVLVAATLSALIWDFFFIPPHFTFTIGSSEDVLLLVMYFVVASLSGIINYRVRQFDQVKQEKEDRESALQLYNTLFSSLSHELRTPIAAIIGAADVLQENEAQLSPQQRKELVSEVSNGALRLSGHVENLLNISRLDAGMIQAKREWCDLSDIVYSAVNVMKKNGNTHRIIVNIPDPFPLIQLDFGLTVQILQNLIANAIIHTPAQTEITISAQIVSEKQGHFEEMDQLENIHLINDKTTHSLLLKVSDNGPGIPPTEIDAIFDKFYRSVHTKADGTGLGLYIVRGFTEAQRGEISVHNQITGGACFVLEFPTIILNQTNQNA